MEALALGKNLPFCTLIVFRLSSCVCMYRRRCFGLGGFAEEVNIQVMQMKQCSRTREMLICKDSRCLSLTMCAAEAEESCKKVLKQHSKGIEETKWPCSDDELTHFALSLHQAAQ